MTDGRVRLFVALELPGSARDVIVRWRGHLPADPGRPIRPVAPETLHVTLCFLGWQPEEDVDAIAAASSIVGSDPPPLLFLRRAVWLPQRQPRVLALELDDVERTLIRLQGSLSDALAAGGWYEPEKRPYLAHVTVARVASGGAAARVGGGGRRGGGRGANLPEPPQIEFHGSRVVLYRSRLLRSGARYEALAKVTLAG